MPPNPEQEHFANLPVGNVLLIAPAGCGKTEALAERARAVVLRGDVSPPRMVLAVTFSNKAKENLARRMAAVVGAGWRTRIGVTNFHGLAARIIKAHGSVVGLQPDLVFPEDVWRRRARADLGITYKNDGPFEQALSLAKSGPFDDDEVMHRLHEYANGAAIAYEERLRAEARLDHDDLLRHASRLLRIPEVSRLYRAHFGMTMVDEVQDLSLMQFEMVQAVGGNAVTYAGDPAQGIYSFAGADPVAVFERINALDPEVVEFNRSYRSSPAVLRAVNTLAEVIGSTQLVCADPSAWPDEGRIISVERADKDSEAEAIMRYVEELTKDPKTTVGIVGRRGSRANQIRDAATAAGLTFEDWAVATHVPAVVALLHRCVDEATSAGLPQDEALTRLGELCQELIDATDAETQNELAGALDVLRGLVDDGMSVRDAVATCKASAAPGTPVGPGVHVLSGHKGKGQEFDWVVVIGLEAGHIPDFRTTTGAEHDEELRVLHVMVSRARYGVIVTFARHDGYKNSIPSPWLEHLRATATETDHA